jgi:PAS domain S-box-containing protein
MFDRVERKTTTGNSGRGRMRRTLGWYAHSVRDDLAASPRRLLFAAAATVGIWDILMIAWMPWDGRHVGVLAASAVVAGVTAALIAEFQRRGRAERAARENEHRYRFLTDHAFDMIVLFDPKTQRRSYVSPAVRRLYGYEPEEAMSLVADRVIHPSDFDRVRDAVSRLKHGSEEPLVRYRGRRKDGTYIWVEASLTSLRNPETGVTEIVSVVRDITDRIRFETALRQAKEQADAASNSKSRFLATMSHELRTPLNAIIGFAEVMQLEVMGPIGNQQYRSYVTDIHSSGTHLLQLINDILDLTKAEAGKLDLYEETIDLTAVMRSVMRMSRAAITKADVTVKTSLPPELPQLLADERKVRQVLLNLIDNAVKFTPAGGKVDITGRADADAGIIITVADTGIGIAAADLPRILEPFTQVESELSRQHAGTGLGLAAVKAIMELHGGTLELKSSVGAGTEATVTFPPARIVSGDLTRLPSPTAA